MFLQSTTIKRAAPLLISSATSLYIVLRARKLSMADPSNATLLQFVGDQPDLVTVLVGMPVYWYVVHRRNQLTQSGKQGIMRGKAAQRVHSLRQAFSALLLGTELLARRADQANQPDLARLARRLSQVVRQGITDLRALGEPYPPDLERIYAAQHRAHNDGANGLNQAYLQ